MSTFRSFTLSSNWILDKKDRYTVPGTKTGTVHEIRTVGVSQTWSADDSPNAEDPCVFTNVHLTGVVRDIQTGKKIKGLQVQDNEHFTDGLPQFIQVELDEMFKVQNALWWRVQGPLRSLRRHMEPNSV